MSCRRVAGRGVAGTVLSIWRMMTIRRGPDHTSAVLLPVSTLALHLECAPAGDDVWSQMSLAFRMTSKRCPPPGPPAAVTCHKGVGHFYTHA